jgi:hypothetical protein
MAIACYWLLLIITNQRRFVDLEIKDKGVPLRTARRTPFLFCILMK